MVARVFDANLIFESRRSGWVALAGAVLFGACTTGTLNRDAGALDSGDASNGLGDAGLDGGGLPPNPMCEALGFATRAFDATAKGTQRGQPAGDFVLDLVDGGTWTWSQNFLGCESLVFLLDNQAISATKPNSYWTQPDLAALLADSPSDVHYFFLSGASTEGAALANVNGLEAQLPMAFATLSPSQQSSWRSHLHFVKTRAGAVGGWLGTALRGWAAEGLAIDQRQELRGVGYFSDIHRVDATAGAWPYETNLAYAANEAIYMNGQERIAERLDAKRRRGGANLFR